MNGQQETDALGRLAYAVRDAVGARAVELDPEGLAADGGLGLAVADLSTGRETEAAAQEVATRLVAALGDIAGSIPPPALPQPTRGADGHSFRRRKS